MLVDLNKLSMVYLAGMLVNAQNRLCKEVEKDISEDDNGKPFPFHCHGCPVELSGVELHSKILSFSHNIKCINIINAWLVLWYQWYFWEGWIEFLSFSPCHKMIKLVFVFQDSPWAPIGLPLIYSYISNFHLAATYI